MGHKFRPLKMKL